MIVECYIGCYGMQWRYKNSDFDIEEKREVAFKAQIFAGLAFKKDIIDKIFTEVEQILFIEEPAGYQRILEKGKSIGIKEVTLPVLKERFLY